jgi:O-methyltransferase involved in polyketide biosynthesis
VISWEEVLRLDSIPAGRRTELAGRLGETLVEKMFHGHLKGIGFGWVVESVAPYLPEEQQKRVMNALNERGRPGKKDFRHAMHIVKDTFPEHQAYLINGIFHSDLDVAMCSADRLRFVPVKSETIAWWCRELAKYEGRSEVRKTLLSSAQWVEKRRATA